MKRAAAQTLALAAAALCAGCGNSYFDDWPPSYRQESIRVGEARDAVGPRATGQGMVKAGEPRLRREPPALRPGNGEPATLDRDGKDLIRARIWDI